MLNDGLAASERPGHRCHAPFRDRKQRVDNALSRHHGLVRRQFFSIRTPLSNRPFPEHANGHTSLFRVEHGHGLFDSVVSFGDGKHLSFHSVRNHNAMFDDFRFPDHAQDIAFRNKVSRFDAGNEMPLFIAVEIIDGNASRNTVAVFEIERGQRTLYAVENARDESRRQLRRKGFSRGIHFFSRSQSRRFLVDLNRSLVAAQFYNFSDKPLFGYADHVVHFRVRHVLRDNQGTGNFYCLACHEFFLAYSLLNKMSTPSALSMALFNISMP